MKNYLLVLLITLISSFAWGQSHVLKGIVSDELSGEPLINATVVVKGTTDGTITDFDGRFELKTTQPLPLTLVVSYVGYSDKEVEVADASKYIKVNLGEDAITIDAIEVKGRRISEKQQQRPLTVETLDNIAIVETPAANFYDGMGAMKDVDLTAASLGFKIVNTRGFNSTSPVRSLQTIDGVDNQSPGLNFSLGNFLGASDLDVNRVNLIIGASSAYYGPNAFNGVIAMETKNPFIKRGLSASVKAGERNLRETAIRWADVVNNKDGQAFMAYKINAFYLSADDWVADNDEAVDDTDSAYGNPGGWDAVNTYGDEYFSLNDFSDEQANLPSDRAGLGLFHRPGYNEIDLVDYDTRNMKLGAALHFRLQPQKEFESPELIMAVNYGTGTTVYQGDNRFSLRNIRFFQPKIELSKKDKWFVRAYMTKEDAGDSYDPYFTALRLQEMAKKDDLWAQDYTAYWRFNVYPQMRENGYPTPSVSGQGQLIFDYDAARQWLTDHHDQLIQWHAETRDAANKANILNSETVDYFVPGTERFQMAFDSITSMKNTEGGTLFFDESALYHAHGEYIFTPEWMDRITVGANARYYTPFSDGTVFSDTSGTKITNFEYGIYTGLEKKFGREWSLSATFRMDKNENFDFLFTPAASVVYSPNINNFFRFSFSSGIRNPTLTDQYLNLNVGRATLLGNLNGYENLLTVESFVDYLGTFDRSLLDTLNIAPVRPEQVKTFELGYRTTLFDQLYLDATYYYNVYDHFIGYNLGVETEFNFFGFPTNTKAYRVAANSTNQVTTQGFSIGMNYYFSNYYAINGNYSWNKLNKAFPDDPIIPAYNTPEHKYNIGVSARNIPVKLGFSPGTKFGFNFNYKWVQGFLFEGSPQFTGYIDDYAMLDGQVNLKFPKINTTFKLGASNILNTLTYQTYGGPQIGRLAYVSVLYNFEKK